MPGTDFPIAKKIEPIFKINGAYYQKVNAADGMGNAQSIRARILAADGTSAIKWFVPIEFPPASEPASETKAETKAETKKGTAAA